jgi:hypothetical protein
MKTAEEIVQQMVEEMPFHMDKSCKPYIYEAIEAYANQFRIIERLIENGIWVEIWISPTNTWVYCIRTLPNKETIWGRGSFPTYTAALSDAIEYLRPLGYLEGVV